MAFYYEERRLTKVNIVQKEQGKEHVPIHEKVTPEIIMRI